MKLTMLHVPSFSGRLSAAPVNAKASRLVELCYVSIISPGTNRMLIYVNKVSVAEGPAGF